MRNPKVTEDYIRKVSTEKPHKKSFEKLQRAADFTVEHSINNFPSIYSHSLMYLRSLSMRCRITSSTIETYGRLAEEEIPAGDLEQRTTSMRKASFKQWLSLIHI